MQLSQAETAKPVKIRPAKAGMTTVEYAMIGAGVLTFSLLALGASGSNLNDLFSLVKTDFKSQI